MIIRYANSHLELYTNGINDMDHHEDDILFTLSWGDDNDNGNVYVCDADDIIPEGYKEIQVPTTLPVYRYILNMTRNEYMESIAPMYLDSVNRIVRDLGWNKSESIYFLNTAGSVIYMTIGRVYPYGYTNIMMTIRKLYIDIINENNEGYTRVYPSYRMLRSHIYSDIIIQ